MKDKIEMVNLKSQYNSIKSEIDEAVLNCMDEADFINGKPVLEFQNSLEHYLNVKHVIPCANGTDSLQIAMMALNLQPNDEVICPSFTYAATAEVIGLLGLKPVMVGVNYNTFNLTVDHIKKSITSKTRAIVPVHLFGQSCDMDPIINLANEYGLYIIEDNAQAIGANYLGSDGISKKTGTLGHIGSTSFFPSKNLGCFGDGGALCTNDDELASKMRIIANHGQEKKYYHKYIGCNSRLDSIQAAILNVKLKYLDKYIKKRQEMAFYYDEAFKNIKQVIIPERDSKSSHVFHQYTLKISGNRRDELKQYLFEKGIPSMVYYPLPLYKQEAYRSYVNDDYNIPIVERLCEEVLSFPIHTERDENVQNYIIDTVLSFFK